MAMGRRNLRPTSRQIEENFARRKETVLQTRIVSGRGAIEIKIGDLGTDGQSAFLVRKGPRFESGRGLHDLGSVDSGIDQTMPRSGTQARLSFSTDAARRG